MRAREGVAAVGGRPDRCGSSAREVYVPQMGLVVCGNQLGDRRVDLLGPVPSAHLTRCYRHQRVWADAGRQAQVTEPEHHQRGDQPSSGPGRAMPGVGADPLDEGVRSDTASTYTWWANTTVLFR